MCGQYRVGGDLRRRDRGLFEVLTALGRTTEEKQEKTWADGASEHYYDKQSCDSISNKYANIG